MKRTGKVICAMIVLLQSVAAVSCGEQQSPSDLILPSGYRSLFNFETYAEFNGVMQQNYFGKYALNTETRYIKNGKASARLEPCGEGYADPYSRPRLVMYPAKIAEENADFSKAERVVFDIYNMSEESKNCYFSLDVASSGDVLATESRTYVLPPKAWSKCVYEIEYEKLAYIYDFSALESLTLEFDGLTPDEPRTTYYLDNVLVKETDEKRTVTPIELAADEFCDFEKDYQRYLFYVTGYGAYKPYVPEITINTDPRYVSRGEKSLKLHIPHGTENESCYVRIMFCEALVEKANLAGRGEEYEIVFDLYNASDSIFHIESDVRSEKKSYAIAYTPTPNKWVECRLSLAEANKANPSKEGEASFLSQIKSYEITYGNFAGSGAEDDKDIYIDNIRLELRKD